VVLSDFSRDSLRYVLKEIAFDANKTDYPIEILIVDTRSIFYPLPSNLLNFPLPKHLVVNKVHHPFDGYASSRRAALEWVLENKPNYSLLFIDDDDIPDPNCIQNFIVAHNDNESAILTGRVIRFGENVKVGLNVPTLKSLSGISGASMMWIPGDLLFQCREWLPERLNFSGGEDTSICLRAIESNIPIIKVKGSLACEVKPQLQFSASQKRIKIFQESWVLSSVIWFGSSRRKIYLISQILFLLLRATLRIPFQPRIGALKISGFLLGVLFETPPPRKWIWSVQLEHLRAKLSVSMRHNLKMR
jgi:hypothetical protein